MLHTLWSRCPVSRTCDKGQAHGPPARPRLVISRVPSRSSRLLLSRGYPSGPTRLYFSINCEVTVTLYGNCVFITPRRNPRNHPRGLLLDAIVKANSKESPSMNSHLRCCRHCTIGGRVRGITLGNSYPTGYHRRWSKRNHPR